jgi:hypothetical protein
MEHYWREPSAKRKIHYSGVKSHALMLSLVQWTDGKPKRQTGTNFRHSYSAGAYCLVVVRRQLWAKSISWPDRRPHDDRKPPPPPADKLTSLGQPVRSRDGIVATSAHKPAPSAPGIRGIDHPWRRTSRWFGGCTAIGSGSEPAVREILRRSKL